MKVCEELVERLDDMGYEIDRIGTVGVHDEYISMNADGSMSICKYRGVNHIAIIVKKIKWRAESGGKYLYLRFSPQSYKMIVDHATDSRDIHSNDLFKSGNYFNPIFDHDTQVKADKMNAIIMGED